MKIAFAKIQSEEVPFKLKKGLVSFAGTLKLKKKNIVNLVACLKAKFKRVCDRCGKEVACDHKEDLNLFISDGVYENDTSKLYVIEVFGGFIVLDDIMQSELNLVKSDYFYCNTCQS